MRNGDMVLRPAAQADRPALVRIWRRAVEATHAFLTPSDVDAIEPQLRAMALSTLTLAQPAGRGPVGWIDVHADHVAALFVDPQVHRQGVGTALLESATAGRATVTVDVNEDNPTAIRFYDRLGFVPVGRSERDPDGRFFPLLHLRRASAPPGP